MKYVCTVISVADISAARKFYEELFGVEVYQDYGRNIAFTCGLALQQDFDWLVSIPKEKVLKKSNNAEIVFEEQDFDGFLNKLKAYSDIAYLGEVIEPDYTLSPAMLNDFSQIFDVRVCFQLIQETIKILFLKDDLRIVGFLQYLFLWYTYQPVKILL